MRVALTLGIEAAIDEKTIWMGLKILLRLVIISCRKVALSSSFYGLVFSSICLSEGSSSCFLEFRYFRSKENSTTRTLRETERYSFALIYRSANFLTNASSFVVSAPEKVSRASCPS